MINNAVLNSETINGEAQNKQRRYYLKNQNILSLFFIFIHSKLSLHLERKHTVIIHWMFTLCSQIFGLATFFF